MATLCNLIRRLKATDDLAEIMDHDDTTSNTMEPQPTVKRRNDDYIAVATEDDSEDVSEETLEEAAYSVFSNRQRLMIVMLVAIAGFFSPFTAFIYFPALKSIASDFDVSIELMNITITMYLIVQAIAPTVLGDLSEHLGRRPVYLLSFSIYCAASLGLALQRNYATLLLLRMSQSAGSSATIALAYGVIGDIAAPHERGRYVGLSHIGFNTAPALGPLIGGLIADKVGWPWIFIFLTALSGGVLMLLAVFLYETGRGIVGNGSITAVGLNRALIQGIRKDYGEDVVQRAHLQVPNILPCLRLIFHKTTFPILLANATYYTMYSCLQATLAPLLQQIYGLTPLQAGLCYFPYGLAGGIASYALGRVTDRDYRIVAAQHDLQIDRLRGDNLKHFPIEKARLRSIWIYLSICATSVMGYGWTLTARTHLAAPLILCFSTGFTVTGIFNVCNTLIVDMHPEHPATASASVSITRCLVAAGGVAIIQVIISEIGPGWAFTVVGLLCWLMLPVLWIVYQRGWEWRNALES